LISRQLVFGKESHFTCLRPRLGVAAASPLCAPQATPPTRRKGAFPCITKADAIGYAGCVQRVRAIDDPRQGDRRPGSRTVIRQAPGSTKGTIHSATHSSSIGRRSWCARKTAAVEVSAAKVRGQAYVGGGCLSGTFSRAYGRTSSVWLKSAKPTAARWNKKPPCSARICWGHLMIQQELT
jgi:hypothetical protein